MSALVLEDLRGMSPCLVDKMRQIRLSQRRHIGHAVISLDVDAAVSILDAVVDGVDVEGGQEAAALLGKVSLYHLLLHGGICK